MGRLLVEDALWEQVQPLLPVPKPRRPRNAGRKPLDDRAALTGILFILKTRLPWNDLPREMGCGSGSACWLRLREWHRLGVWTALHPVLLAGLYYARRIDWNRAATEATGRKVPPGESVMNVPPPKNRREAGKRGAPESRAKAGDGAPPTAKTSAVNHRTNVRKDTGAIPDGRRFTIRGWIPLRKGAKRP